MQDAGSQLLGARRQIRELHNTPSLLLFDLIANTPLDLYIAGLPGIDLNLFADMADVDRNRIVRPNGLFVPDLLIDLVNREHLPGIFNQEQQDICLLYTSPSPRDTR